jgi:hypothetical protein
MDQPMSEEDNEDLRERTNLTVRQLRRALARGQLLRPITEQAIERHRRGYRGHESRGFAK